MNDNDGVIKRIKQLLTTCAALAVFSCAPQPVAAQTSQTCMDLSVLAETVHQAKTKGVPQKVTMQIIDEAACRDRICEARLRLNREIVSLAYASKLDETELKLVYNHRCMQRLNIFF